MREPPLTCAGLLGALLVLVGFCGLLVAFLVERHGVHLQGLVAAVVLIVVGAAFSATSEETRRGTWIPGGAQPILRPDELRAIERLAGPTSWSSPTTLHHGFRRGDLDGELHLWLEPLQPGYAALTIALWAPPGAVREGPRVIHAARDDVARVLPRGLAGPVEALLRQADEVRLVGPRLEVRVRRPADARALLGRPGGLDGLLAGLRAVAACSPAGAPLPTGATCPYCHDPLEAASSGPVAACAACGVRHHEECLDEHGGCTVTGCRDAPDLRARAPA